MLSENEVKVLAEAKEANPHWFTALMAAARIMSQRRKKYAGKHHPYYNFADMALREGRSLTSIFRTYLNIKMSRLVASQDQDFEDESTADTFLDIANYGLIAAGAALENLTIEEIREYSEGKDEGA